MHPLLLWMATKPDEQSPPLSFSQLTLQARFNNISRRLLAATTAQRNFPDSSGKFFFDIFSKAGAPLLKALQVYPRWPSLVPSITPSLKEELRSMVIFLFFAVNNLQADDVPSAADKHAPYNTRIADFIFTGEFEVFMRCMGFGPLDCSAALHLV